MTSALEHPPVRSLFRPAALAHAGRGRHGTVLLARPVAHAFLTLLFVSFAIGLVAFFFSFAYTRKVRVPGVLLPSLGLIRVVPAHAGRVVERRVVEGQHVARGDVLFVLASERESAYQGSAQGSHGSAESTESAVSRLLEARRDSLLNEQRQLGRQAEQRMVGARQRSSDLASELRRSDDQIALQGRRIGLVEQGLARALQLEAAHFLSAVQVQDRQADLIDQQQRQGELRRARAAVERERATAESDLRDLVIQLERDQGGIARTVAGLQQELAENEARREIRVVAPQDGVVTAITAEPGQTVGGAQSLATIVPSGSELEAELYAPSRAAGFLKPGMTVQLHYQAYAYQKFGAARGIVREVAGSSVRPDELVLPGAAVAPGAATEPLYRVRVKQAVTAYGAEEPLRSGGALDASILLESRRLYEWVLEPLYTVTGRA